MTKRTKVRKPATRIEFRNGERIVTDIAKARAAARKAWINRGSPIPGQPRPPKPEPTPDEVAEAMAVIISVSEQRKARAKTARRLEGAVKRAYRKRIGKGVATITEQTASRHTKTSFARMVDRKEITGPMMQAAQEIDRVYMGLTGMLVMGGSAMEPRSKGQAAAMPEAVATAHAKRYLPWARLMADWRKRGGPPALEIIIDVVVDGRPLTCIDRERQWRNGTAKHVVRLALLKYAVLAQWAPSADMARLVTVRRAA